MEENKEKLEEEIENDAVEQPSEEAEELKLQEIDEETDTDEEIEEDNEILFSVPFTINLEELYQFQIDMSKEQIAKNRKRSRIISIVEVVMGFIYAGGIIAGRIDNGFMQYILAAALFGMGLYGLAYYKYFFYPSLRKSVAKQHSKTPYFQSENTIEIYDNKCIECVGDRRTSNFWHNMVSIIEGENAYYLQLEKNRCLVIPKRCATPELEPFLRNACERFEKKWVSA